MRRWVVGFALTAVSVVAALFFWPDHEPRYEGRSVSYWFEQYCRLQGARIVTPMILRQVVTLSGGRSATNVVNLTNNVVVMASGVAPQLWAGTATGEQPAMALRALGSNAVPYLVKILKRRPSTPRHLYSVLHTKCPAWLQRLLPAPLPIELQHAYAAEALALLQAEGRLAIPELVSLLVKADDSLNSTMARALRTIGIQAADLEPVLMGLKQRKKFKAAFAVIGEFTQQTQTPTAVALLREILRNGAAEQRSGAAFALERRASLAAAALPDLVAALKDPDKETRYGAVRALCEMGALATTAIPELEQVARHDPDVKVRTRATKSILRIQGKISPDAL